MPVYLTRDLQIVNQPARLAAEIPNLLGIILHNEYDKGEIGFGEHWIAMSDFVFDPETNPKLVQDYLWELAALLFPEYAPTNQNGIKGYSEASGVWD